MPLRSHYRSLKVLQRSLNHHQVHSKIVVIDSPTCEMSTLISHLQSIIHSFKTTSSKVIVKAFGATKSIRRNDSQLTIRLSQATWQDTVIKNEEEVEEEEEDLCQSLVCRQIVCLVRSRHVRGSPLSDESDCWTWHISPHKRDIDRYFSDFVYEARTRKIKPQEAPPPRG